MCLSAPEPCGGSDLQWLVQSSSNVCGRSRSGRAFGPVWTRGRVCVYAQHPWCGMCQGSMGRMASSFSSLFRRSPRRCRVARPLAPSSLLTSAPPFFSADVLKKCALLGMNLTAEEGRGGGSGCRTLKLGDSRRYGCPWSPMLESEGEAWYEDDGVSASVSRENNVCNDALHVIGLYGPGDKISLFLKDWELARVALSCHIALDMLCQEMHEAR